MKKLLIALGLIAASGTANAQLSWSELATANRTEIFNIADFPVLGIDSFVSLGALSNTQKGTITFTYLGQESGFNDSFHLTVNSTHLFESNTIGTSISAVLDTTGYVNFKFEGNTDQFANNGLMSGWAPGTSIGLIGTNYTVASGSGQGTYAFVLGFNDSAGAAHLGDWDDFVVGVNFTTAIPEPETYAMLLAGLGLLGFATRRRKLKLAA